MPDFTFTLRDDAGRAIAGPLSQSTALELEIDAAGDLKFSTFPAVVAEVLVEVEAAGPREASITFSPPSSRVVRVADVDRAGGAAVWGVSALGAGAALTLSFEAPGASGATNAWEFSSPPGGGVGYETLRIKVKLKRKS
ncbi:MAG: hypothetical protein H6713_15210 [Myxococcales bacterium]|nr:hypothetical protein [Myxococcales bacterium]MCB9751324.1 hypothetical protein [Myxococcales bacterium]